MKKNYIPLHLKYRPQNFKTIIGHTGIKNYLELVIKENKISFAYLFTGLQGTGKTTLARIVAKSLNCTNQGVFPCNLCESCLKIHRGESLDFYEIDAAKNTGIDNIREIIENLQFSPIMSRYKICIIDEVHMLSNSAFNSLLKTLESPPANTVFILLTTCINKVPDTVISRCQQIFFNTISDEDLGMSLYQIVNNEKLLITNKALFNILKLVKGSFREALSIVERFALQKLPITAEYLNQNYLIPKSILIESLIKRIFALNILESVIIINYIQFYNWDITEITNIMYSQIVNRFIQNKILNSTNKSYLISTQKLNHILKILKDYKYNKKTFFLNSLIIAIALDINKIIKIKTRQERKKIYIQIKKSKIISN